MVDTQSELGNLTLWLLQVRSRWAKNFYHHLLHYKSCLKRRGTPKKLFILKTVLLVLTNTDTASNYYLVYKSKLPTKATEKRIKQFPSPRIYTGDLPLMEIPRHSRILMDMIIILLLSIYICVNHIFSVYFDDHWFHS